MTSNNPHDPYLDPQTGVLQNKLGINDSEELAAAEADLTFARTIWLSGHPPPGSFDLDHLRLIHRLLFGDIYDWAGELRTVLISRTEPFCLPQHLEASATKAFAELREETWLRDLPRSEFVDRLAYHLGEVNALHPFREGNGRTHAPSSLNSAEKLAGKSTGVALIARLTMRPAGQVSGGTWRRSRHC